MRWIRASVQFLGCGCMALVAMAIVLSVPGAGRASTNLRLELAEVAKDIKKLLLGRHEDEIAVGAFTGPSYLESSAGPAIAKALAEELHKQGITVKRRASLEAKGDYVDVVDKKTDRLAAQLKVRVLDRTGTEVVELDRGIFGDVTLASLFGLTTHLPPDAPPKERDQQMRKSIDKPQVAIEGGQVFSHPGGVYAVEVWVAPGSGQKYELRPASNVDGFAFVPISRGEVYGIRLINNSDYECAATLTVDGISMFAFSDIKDSRTGQPLSTHILVPAKKKVFIRGWHRTDTFSEEFLVTEYSKSAAAELHSTVPVGTITACFSAAWPKDGTPPPDEPANPAEHSRGGDATGRGMQFKQKYESVERHFGVVRDTVSVRYTK